MRDAPARLAEAVELSRSIGLDIVQRATLLGSGQVASLGEAIAARMLGAHVPVITCMSRDKPRWPCPGR